MERGSPAVAAGRVEERVVPRRRRFRAFYVTLALLSTLMVIAGFWPYFGPLFIGSLVEQPGIIHIHAAVFGGWMVLLLTQVILVAFGQTRVHRQVGTFGIAYGFLVLLMGLVVSFAAPLMHVSAGEWELDMAASFLLLPLGDMVLFGGFFGTAIAYRTVPAIHKRLIVLATVALIFPAAARLMELHQILWERTAMFMSIFLLVWLSPLLLAMGYDIVTFRRIHMAYLVGAAVLVVGFGRVFIMDSEVWLSVGRAALSVFM